MDSILFRLENLVPACKPEQQPSYSTSYEISAHSGHFSQYWPKLKIWLECISEKKKLKKIKKDEAEAMLEGKQKVKR